MAALPTGTVTFLFTDIAGSTRLLQQLGDRYAEVLDAHHRLLSAAVQEAQGQVLETQGDAVFAVFPRARDALLAAVAAQRGVQAHPWPEGITVRVRMSLHTGEPISRATGYVGMDVHRAARICAAGHGGQILLSQTTRDLVENDMPLGVNLRDLGEHRLKDLAHPHHLFQVVTTDLPGDFPSLRSLDAHSHNLPMQLTSFIGRAREIADVKGLIGAHGLVTLTGSGGAGKTRLALQVAADLVDDYPDGVWLSEFAPIADPALVPKTVASALNVAEQPNRDMTQTLVDALLSKELLLLLDNCEHLLPASRDLAAALLRKCPQVRLLATSRERLGVPGETLWRVPSLSVPANTRQLPSSDKLVQYDAVRLFVDRAVAIAPEFSVTAENAPAVAQVCQRLDGIPLAIELAAARVKVLAVEQIAARLDDRFRLLTGGSPIALHRQQTLRATIDWSYNLLSEPEQVLLRGLSVFAGGWTLEAAESVCAGGSVEAANILDLLTSLVDKSLVLAETQRGEARYRLLETVRQYARDRLLESEKLETTRDRHAGFFLNLAEQAELQLNDAEQVIWFNRLGAEHDNLRAALAWSMRSTPRAGLRLAGALGQFWMRRDNLAEGRRWLEEALENQTGGSAPLRAKALNWAGEIAIRQMDYAAARQFLEKGLAMYRELEDQKGIADSLSDLGALSMYETDHISACALFEQSLAIDRRLGNKSGIVYTLSSLGHATWYRGDLTSARRFLEEALRLAGEYGHRWQEMRILWSLGLVAFGQHNFEEAHSRYEEGLRTARELGDVWFGAFLVEAFAALIAAEGQYVRAARLFGAAEAHRKTTGLPLPLFHRSDYDHPVAIIRAGLKEEAFSATWAEGRAMTLEQAIEYALTPQLS